MGSERAAEAGLTAAQAMELWLWLWLGFVERESARLGKGAATKAGAGVTDPGGELAVLEELSARLSAELPTSPPSTSGAAGRTYARLQGGLPAASVERLAAWLAAPMAEPTAQPAARLRRRAAEVLDQVRRSPPPSPARAAAVDLWAWLTGVEADLRVALSTTGEDRKAARQLGDELRLLQTVQGGVRRGQPDVIPSHRHEGHWLGARQPFQPAAAAELARVLRRAQPEVGAGRGGDGLRHLVEVTASRLEALAGAEAVARAQAREQAETRVKAVRGKIVAGLAAAEATEPRQATARFIGRPVLADAARLGASLVDADLGDQAAWRAVIAPRGFDEVSEFSAAGASAYELYVLVGADGTLRALHQRVDRAPHGRRWFTPAPAPAWLHPQGETLDVAWFDVAAPARARMLLLLAALTSGLPASAVDEQLPDEALAMAARRMRRSRH
jgi:hypothetical protein